MKKVLLWLDDSRDPSTDCWAEAFSPIHHTEVVWVKNYGEFVRHITTHGLPDAVCFDHDLGEEKDGKDCAEFMVNYCMDRGLPAPLYGIQSANPVGRDRITSVIESYNKVYGA